LVFRPVSQSLYDTVKNLQEKGHLAVLGEQTTTTTEAGREECPAADLQQQGGIAIRA
jgi:cinnamoyl-CoA reductase